MYHRFTKHLAKEIYTKFQSAEGESATIDEKQLPKELQGVLAGIASGIQFDSMPDIQSAEIIKKSTKQFYEIINPTLIGTILKYVYNTGRYGDAKQIHADTPAVLIAKKDNYM
jgi:hypothetical protein